MTLSTPIPLNFTSLSSSSSPLHFTILPQTQPVNSFRAQKLKISCCQQTVQFDSETQPLHSFIKKKRKPRPSFVDQIQDKWSLKIPSLRENFPWQEHDIDAPSRIESQEEASKSVSVDSGVETVSIPVPWVRGNEARKKQFRPEVSGPGVCKNANEKVSNEVILDDKSEDNFGDRIRFSGSKEALSAKKGTSSSVKLPWERDEFGEGDRLRGSNTELAERLIPETELKRLRNVALVMVERMKVGEAGVTQALVDDILEKWKDEEVVKLKFEGPPSKNMRRTHEILESRTGGLVIWRSGGLVVLFRGMTYKLDCVKSYSETIREAEPSGDLVKDTPERISVRYLNEAVESSKTPISSNYSDNLSEEENMDLHELNLLLDELGPRFIDWTGRDPLPVDADLLPGIVDGYKPPFRLLPHGIRQTLRNQEMTYLRRTARTMPPHFALGRSRQLQGLASAMAKLWEMSAIAKIAIKRGVLNTNNERMAEELKILTGGTLVSRNKEYIVFYRGNDFLPPGVTGVLTEAEKSTTAMQDEEETARQRAAMLIDRNAKINKLPLVAGTLSETVAATSWWGNQPSSEEIETIMRDTEKTKRASLLKSLQTKKAIAKLKIADAEKALRKLHEDREPTDLPDDLETLTDEERFLFRKIGLSMKPYLLLGRREIFDGTIENMHLHWKYREVVKIIVQRKTSAQVKHIAVSLEAESGGLLVSIEKTTKGHVIIVYRGKNYQPPRAFRPRNLLTKRQALARSVELQRREALKHHVLDLEENIEKLKLELENMEADIEKHQKLKSGE